MRNGLAVVVVGAGVAGLMAAWRLAERGARVTIVERDSVGSHASGFAFGGLYALMGAGIPGPMLQPALAALRLHRDLISALPRASGVALEYVRNPHLALAFAPEEAADLRDSVAWRAEHSPHTRWLDAPGVRSLEPRVEGALGGLLTPDTLEVDAYRFSLSLLHAAERAGATLRHGDITGLVTRGRTVTGVRLGGREIASDAVVLAQGPWAADAEGWLDIPVPVQPLKGEILRLHAEGPPLAAHVTWGSSYASSKPDGLVWAGTTALDAGFDETPSLAARAEIMTRVVERLPYLAEARLVRQTACLRPVTPDSMPIVGRAPGWEGAWLCTGGGRKGILLAPLMGQGLADLVTDGRTDLPLDGMSPERFVAHGRTASEE